MRAVELIKELEKVPPLSRVNVLSDSVVEGQTKQIVKVSFVFLSKNRFDTNIDKAPVGAIIRYQE